ncbi:MAG: hypothetical protein ACRD3W_18100, partial [Terriglobales bacterium]
GLYIVPPDRADEALPAAVTAVRIALFGSNAGLAAGWNLLCAFQMAYLYYLWCVGPIMAALWVWPIKQLRGAFASWVEGVVTLCFWSLFWNTCILLMAAFKGVDETGTLIITALNILATSSVKYAFDFAGLVKAAAQEASQIGAKMGEAAAKASQHGGGGGGGGGGSHSGAKHAGGHASRSASRGHAPGATPVSFTGEPHRTPRVEPAAAEGPRHSSPLQLASYTAAGGGMPRRHGFSDGAGASPSSFSANHADTAHALPPMAQLSQTRHDQHIDPSKHPLPPLHVPANSAEFIHPVAHANTQSAQSGHTPPPPSSVPTDSAPEGMIGLDGIVVDSNSPIVIDDSIDMNNSLSVDSAGYLDRYSDDGTSLIDDSTSFSDYGSRLVDASSSFNDYGSSTFNSTDLTNLRSGLTIDPNTGLPLSNSIDAPLPRTLVASGGDSLSFSSYSSPAAVLPVLAMSALGPNGQPLHLSFSDSALTTNPTSHHFNSDYGTTLVSFDAGYGSNPYSQGISGIVVDENGAATGQSGVTFTAWDNSSFFERDAVTGMLPMTSIVDDPIFVTNADQSVFVPTSAGAFARDA